MLPGYYGIMDVLMCQKLKCVISWHLCRTGYFQLTPTDYCVILRRIFSKITQSEVQQNMVLVWLAVIPVDYRILQNFSLNSKLIFWHTIWRNVCECINFTLLLCLKLITSQHCSLLSTLPQIEGAVFLEIKGVSLLDTKWNCLIVDMSCKYKDVEVTVELSCKM